MGLDLIPLNSPLGCGPGGGVPPSWGGLLGKEVSFAGGCLLCQGVPPSWGGGSIPACTEADPRPVDRITDTSKNITLATTLLRPVIFSHSFRFLTFKKKHALTAFLCCFFRLPITYVLSSMWHGIEPGYYLTFLSIVPVTIAAKKVFFLLMSLFLCVHLRFWKKSSHEQLCVDILQVRRTIRPYFVGTRYKPLYDVLTGISAWCTINYAMGGFHLLHLKETLQLFR